MSDNITLPRELVKKALEAFDQHRFDALTVAEEREYERHAEALRAALAAEQPKPSEDVEALRRDAERYRWLREWMVRHSILCIEYGGVWALRKPHVISSSVGRGKTVDAAIDAAMKEDKR